MGDRVLFFSDPRALSPSFLPFIPPRAAIAGVALFVAALSVPEEARAFCGGGAPDGIGDVGEQCDDGNALSTDGCTNLCTQTPGFSCSCPPGELTGVTVDDPAAPLTVIGGLGGAAFADRCPLGQVTTGFDYTVGPYLGAHDWITSSRAHCATPSVTGSTVTITEVGNTPTHGAGAGASTTLTCDAGSVVAGFVGDSRDEDGFVGIAGVQILCASLTVGASGRVVVGTPVPGPSARPGGGAITVVGASLCPAGRVVSGNEGRAGTIVDQFTMLCQEVYTNCAAPMTCSGVCGDGIVLGLGFGFEACDDGNLVNGDGCSAQCALEPGFTCSHAPSVCTECHTDLECGASKFCDTQTNRCVAKYPNGTAIPTIAGHLPALAGECSVAVGLAVCVVGLCDQVDDACGLLNGTTGCLAGSSPLCRSGVCGSDSACGLPRGEGPCTLGTGPVLCRSGVCSVDGTCRPNAGCNADGDCSATQFCDTGTHLCAARLTNGTPIPTIPGHAPALDGHCSVAVGDAVCIAEVCDTRDDACGLVNGSPCGAGADDDGCRSGVCFDADGVCGLPVGEPCATASACRSNLCNASGRCVSDGGVSDGGVSDGGVSDGGSRDGQMPDPDGGAGNSAGADVSGGAMCSATQGGGPSSPVVLFVAMVGMSLARARRRTVARRA